MGRDNSLIFRSLKDGEAKRCRRFECSLSAWKNYNIPIFIVPEIPSKMKKHRRGNNPQGILYLQLIDDLKFNENTFPFLLSLCHVLFFTGINSKY